MPPKQKPLSPRGRPSLYRADLVERAYELCLLGLTDEQLALCLGVNPDTLYEWKRKHPKFAEALARGRRKADAKVAACLYQRAIGYDHPAVKIFVDKGVPITVPYTEHYPPDVVAQIFWLKNRERDFWRDRHALEHSGPEGEPLIPQDCSVSMIAAELKRRQALPEGLAALFSGRQPLPAKNPTKGKSKCTSG